MEKSLQIEPTSVVGGTVQCLSGDVLIGTDSPAAVTEGIKQACSYIINPHHLAQFSNEVGFYPGGFYQVSGEVLASWLTYHGLHDPYAPIDGDFLTTVTPQSPWDSSPTATKFVETIDTSYVDTDPHSPRAELGISPFLIMAVIALLLMALSDRAGKMNINHGKPTTEQVTKEAKRKEFHDVLDDVHEVIDELRGSNIKKRRKKRSRR